MNNTIIDPISAYQEQDDIRHSNAVCWPDGGSHVPETDRHTAGDSSVSGNGLLAKVSPVPLFLRSSQLSAWLCGCADRAMAKGTASEEMQTQAAPTVMEGPQPD